MKKTVFGHIFISILFLLIGVSIYAIANKNSSAFIVFLRNYGADFCWLFSFVFALHPFVSQLFKSSTHVTGFICFAFSILFELLQKINLIKGTGDLCDVISYLMATIISCLLIKIIYKKRENHEKTF